MTTDFTFSELYSSSTTIRFYDSSGGVDFNFTESGYVPPTGSLTFMFGDSSIIVSRILFGSSNNFSSIWADPKASMSSGKMYVASFDAFSVINLKDKSIYDVYTKEISGRAGEKLSSNNIVDVNVVGI